MSKQWPKYIRSDGGTALYYIRRYPTKLSHRVPGRLFRHQINQTVDSQPWEVAQAAADAERLYLAEVERYTQGDGQALKDDHIEALVDREMARLNVSDMSVSPSSFVAYGDVPREELDDLRALMSDHVADEVVGRIQGDDFVASEVRARVKQRITSRRRTVRTLNELWDAYSSFKQFPTDGGRAARRTQSMWDQVWEHVGNAVVTPAASTTINDGFESYAQQQLDKGVKPQSIRRALAVPFAAAKWLGSVERLDPWTVRLPMLPAGEEEPRMAFSLSQQVELLQACRKAADGPAAIIVMGLIAGALPSEIAMLDNDPSTLTSSHPYVRLSVAGKAVARRRVMPLTVLTDMMVAVMPEAIEYAGRLKDHGTNTIAKRIRTLLGSGSIYNCRHSARGRSITAMDSAGSPIRDSDIASIMGWQQSNQQSEMMRRYSAASLEQTQVLAHLWSVSTAINQPLIEGLGPSADNVSWIKGRSSE